MDPLQDAAQPQGSRGIQLALLRDELAAERKAMAPEELAAEQAELEQASAAFRRMIDNIGKPLREAGVLGVNSLASNGVIPSLSRTMAESMGIGSVVSGITAGFAEDPTRKLFRTVERSLTATLYESSVFKQQQEAVTRLSRVVNDSLAARFSPDLVGRLVQLTTVGFPEIQGWQPRRFLHPSGPTVEAEPDPSESATAELVLAEGIREVAHLLRVVIDLQQLALARAQRGTPWASREVAFLLAGVLFQILWTYHVMFVLQG